MGVTDVTLVSEDTFGDEEDEDEDEGEESYPVIEV